MFERIVYPTDFSEVSNKAARGLRKLRGTEPQSVLVVHVLDQREFHSFVGDVTPGSPLSRDLITHWEDSRRQHAETELERVASDLSSLGYHVITRLEEGIPFLKILEIAEEEHATVIVLGSHGKSNLREILLGSVSENIVRKAMIPVLVIKR